MKNKNLILLTVLFIVLLAVALVLYNSLPKTLDNNNNITPDNSSNISPSTDNTTQNTIPAIDFTVYDIDQNAISFSDFSGKPMVINFWATWCGFCIDEMPHFENAYNNYGEEIDFMMINATDGSRETVKKARDYISANSFSFPVYYDKDFSAIQAYTVTAFPTTIFINSDGQVTNIVKGMLTEQTLEAEIQKLL